MTRYLLGFVLLAGPAFGAGGGTSGAEFLRVPLGARPAALGECFVGLADDVTAAAWNPAGLGRLEHMEFSAMHLSYLADASYEYLAAAMPVGRFGAVALSGAYVGVAPFDSTVSPFNPAGTSADASATDGMLAVSWGVPFISISPETKELSSLYVGLTAKLVYRSLGGYAGSGASESFSATAAAADFGLFYEASDRFGMGVSIQNVGSTISFLGEEEDSLPLALRAGASFKAMDESWLSALIVAELVKPTDQDGGEFEAATWGGGGVEFLISEMLALRAGFRQGPDGMRVVGGAGVTYSGISLDYAFVPLSDLGSEGIQGHRMGIRVKLGAPAARRLPAPQDLAAAGVSGNRMRLSWLEVPGAAGYHLELMKPGEKEFQRVTKEPRQDTELVLRGLRSGQEYGLRVVALDAKGREGRPADLVFVPKPPELESPAKVDAKLTGRRVDLSWPAVEGAVGYHVYYRRGAGAKWQRATKSVKKTTSAYFRNLSPIEYQFAVRSVGEDGKMSKARAVSVVVK